MLESILICCLTMICSYLFVVWAYAFMWKNLIDKFNDLEKTTKEFEKEVLLMKNELSELKKILNVKQQINKIENKTTNYSGW